MKKTTIVAAALAGMMTLVAGTFPLAGEMNSTPTSLGRTNHSDVAVMPGTGAETVRLHFAGADLLYPDFPGGLKVFTVDGGMKHYRPEAYQLINGKIKPVEMQLHIEGKDEATVQFGKIDRSAPVFLKRNAMVSGPTAGM